MAKSSQKKTVAERAVDLSDDVLESVQRQTADRDRGHAQVR